MKTDLQIVDEAAQLLERSDDGAYVRRLTEGRLRSIIIDGTFYFDEAGKLISPEEFHEQRERQG